MDLSSKKISSLWKNWILPIGIAFLLSTIVSKFFFYIIYVPTGSMYPTIVPGDRILTSVVHNKDKLKREDIVVFDSKEIGKPLVKRLIGLPGDVIQIEKDGTLYINNKLYREPYVKNQIDPLENYEGMNLGIFTVPKDKYFFLGDNRISSEDSRYLQNPYISKDDIKGKAKIVLYPFKRFGRLH